MEEAALAQEAEANRLIKTTIGFSERPPLRGPTR